MSRNVDLTPRFRALYLSAAIASCTTVLCAWYLSHAVRALLKFRDFSVYVQPTVQLILVGVALVFAVVAYFYRTNFTANLNAKMAFVVVLTGLLASVVVLVLGNV